MIVVVIIIIIIGSESCLSLLKSAVKIKHNRSPGLHYQMYFKFILRNTRHSRFMPYCSACPPSVATYAEQAFSIRLWRWGWNQINGDLGQKWIFNLVSLPELDGTAIQNCTRAHFSSIVGKFSLLDQHEQMLTGYKNWTVAAAGTWTASKSCMFQARSQPIAAVLHLGNCCQRYYSFCFGFFRFCFILFFIFSF